MKRKYLNIFLLGLVLVVSSVFLTGCTSKKDYDTSKVDIVDVDEDKDDEEQAEENETTKTEEEESSDEKTEDVGDSDTLNFSRNTQSIGSENDNEYVLVSLTDTPKSGYHEFIFTIEAKNEVTSIPYVLVSYKPSLGCIRVDFDGITTDNSGITYQRSKSINKEGIIRVYHNISSDQTEELYDIGVSASTPFYLYYKELSAGKWNVILDVKYPGDNSLDIDLGSTEFSTGKQSIVGAVANDGAAVTGYSYSVSGGQLVFVWAVTGSSSKPIPSVSAELGDDGILNIKFESVVSDKAASAVKNVTLPGNISLTYSNGVYHFAVGADREFKLSASTSPNQVELTVKL